ncbi:CFEM domain-containing protein [Aspergillus tubingensis]|nr:aminotransferase class I and II family protein [Aspergillus tubingensis]GFN11825.1 aminotransferase class I and II family protein [Aspergillus tubingensis]
MNLQQAIRQLFSINTQYSLSDDATSRSHLVAHKFRDIPRCSLNCLYPQILSTCSHTDYACLCTSLSIIAATTQFQSCFHQCPINPDQRLTPNSLLSLCNLFNIHPTLPDYMTANVNLDRRAEFINDAQTIYSIVTTIYASTQSTSSTETSLPLTTEVITTTDESEVGTTTQTIFSTATDSTTSDDDTPTTTSEQPNVVTVTETRLVSTMRMTSVATQTSSSNSNNAGGLSTGAKAGIGVAVPIGVAIIALLIFAWFQRRRKRKQQAGDISTSEESGQATTIQHAEGKGQSLTQNITTVLPEIDGAPLNESDSRPVHNSADRPVFELSTGSVRRPRRDDARVESGAVSVDGINAKQGAVGGEVASSASATLGEAPAELSSDGVRDGESTASVVAYERMSSSELQEELARVARSRERLQYLQTLEEREDMIRRVLAGHGEDNVSKAESRGEGGSG